MSIFVRDDRGRFSHENVFVDIRITPDVISRATVTAILAVLVTTSLQNSKPIAVSEIKKTAANDQVNSYCAGPAGM
jgi:hypothetical protein